MQCPQSHALKHVLPRQNVTNLRFVRDASLTSAIGRGIRKGANSLERLGTGPRTPKPTARSSTPPRSRLDIERSEQVRKPRPNKWTKDREPRSFISEQAPLGVPYTTAGSEFIYGTFAVTAALEARRRQIHKLYVWKGEQQSGDEHDVSIPKLARSQRVSVQEVAGDWDKMMSRMSGQRPHNGFVLEASPIPRLPITALGMMDSLESMLTAIAVPQSAEDSTTNKIFKTDGPLATIPRISSSARYPLLLWLDRVTDTGNLGAIIRTACFFGVDAIVIPEHGTAPFSPVTIKASAGAAEYLPVLTVRKELDFIRLSQANGWKFFAAVAPQSASTKRSAVGAQAASVAHELDSHPCVLMVGNEAEGLRSFMQKAADAPISIEGVRSSLKVIDSLNVSVAAALLVARFMAPPSKSSVIIDSPLSTPQSSAENQSENAF